MTLTKHHKKHEEQWIREQEQKIIEAMKKKKEEKIRQQLCKEEEQKRKELKELHYMHCPKCGSDMTEICLDEIIVDRCSFCEGIFFDKGELEELLRKKAEQKKSFFKKLIGF